MPRLPNPKTKEGHAITEGINSSGYTQAKLAEELDITPGFISQFANGHRPVPWNKAQALARLIHREPEEISEEYRKIKKHFQELVKKTSSDDGLWASVIAYDQCMGLGTTGPEIAEDADSHVLKFRKDLLNKKHLNHKNLVVMHGTGDSMLPNIESGDAIMFDLSDTIPHDKSIYVIMTPGAVADEYNVKRCIIDTNDQVFFAADNPLGDHGWKSPRWKDDPNYPIKIIGRVRWIGGWVE